MGSFGVLWRPLGSFGVLWGPLGSFGVISRTENYKFKLFNLYTFTKQSWRFIFVVINSKYFTSRSPVLHRGFLFVFYDDITLTPEKWAKAINDLVRLFEFIFQKS